MDKCQFCHLTASTAFFLVSVLLLSSLPVSEGFYDAVIIEGENLIPFSGNSAHANKCMSMTNNCAK
jgi:hypothetical protein